MSKFKVGDRVRLIGYPSGCWGLWEKGDSGTVAFVHRSEWYSVCVDRKPNECDSGGAFVVGGHHMERLKDEWRKLAPTEDAEEGDEARGNGKVFVCDSFGYFDDAIDFAVDCDMRRLGFEIYRKVAPIDPSNTPPDEQLWGAVWRDDDYNRTSVARLNEPEHEVELDVLVEEARVRGAAGDWW